MTEMNPAEAKDEIDTMIDNARFRCFRPIRVAEILYHSRIGREFDLSEPETYRVESGRWRDKVAKELTGKGSSSSKSYQKDFLDLISKALPALDRLNKENSGMIENYIYRKLREDKWRGLIDAQSYVNGTEATEFSLEEYMSFTKESGLQEDALMEIAVYALFSAMSEELEAKAKLELENPDREILYDFEEFAEIFLGITPDNPSIETQVRVHRAGSGTYSSDKGVDIGTNFGTMVQVKHVSLTKGTARKIEEQAYVNRVVVVCREADKEIIDNVAKQLGYDKIRAIVTLGELTEWYAKAFGTYQDTIGESLLRHLRDEFNSEFTEGSFRIPQIDRFLDERGYSEDDLEEPWTVRA